MELRNVMIKGIENDRRNEELRKEGNGRRQG